MTRDEFGKEFMRAMRFILQKHDRERFAVIRAQSARNNAPSADDERVLRANDALNEAETNLDAAIDQLSDHVYDAMHGAGVE